ncbi:MAG: threonine-phosphate decarboxylase CobD [Nitrospiraceae bacterium]
MNGVVTHGGNLYAAARASGRRLQSLIDFSASINPLGPSPHAIRAIVSALPLTAHYPDPDCVALRQALAAHYRLIPDQLLIGNGSTELIHLLPRALAIRQALIIGPTFSEYARAVMLAGGRVLPAQAQRSDEYRPPIERAIEILRKNRTSIDAVFLCNPNSPTGQAVDVERVVELVQAISRRGGRGIIDETFIEYCAERSILPHLNRVSRLLVLRSFTKFYALPGLRIGCLAGPVEDVRRMKPWQPPWSVNTLSQAAVTAAVRDVGYARKSRAFMDAERARLAKRLEALPEVVVFPSEANFLLLELSRRHSARQIVGALGRQGLLVRDCSSIDGLDSRMIRIAVRTEAENRRLLIAFRRLLS